MYIHAVALKLREAETDSINFDDDFADESVTIKWEQFFSNEPLTALIAQCCPWQVVGEQQLSLYHPDIVAYFARLTNYDLKNYLHLSYIHGDEGIEQLSQLLDSEILSADQLQLLVADILTGDISRNDYFRLVYLSTKNEKFARIAANAKTILNAGRVPFSGKNLWGIRIPNADLRGAILHCSNLCGANLE